MKNLFRNITVLGLTCGLAALVLIGCKTTVRGTFPGGIEGEIIVEVGDEVPNLPEGYTLCGPPRQMQGYQICEYCNPNDPTAPRFVQVNCEGGFRRVSPLPMASGPKLAPPPNGKVEYKGSLEADDRVLTEWAGSVKLAVSFNADRLLPEHPESLVTVNGVPAGGASVVRAGSRIALSGEVADVMFDAYHLGFRSIEVKGVLGTLELRMVPDLGLCEVWVNGTLEDVRFVTR
jgi:hypothetical protein